MFTWICPQCGAEVPPAYTDCPNCKPVAAEAPTIIQPPPPPAPSPRTVTLPPPPAPRAMSSPPRPTAPTPTAPPPVQYAPPPQPQYQAPPPPPPQYAYPPPASGTPAWLVTLGVFLGLTVAGYAFYTLVLNKNGASASTQTEEPAAAPATGRGGRDLSKNLEATAIRIIEENRKPSIRLMLVNHSGSDMASLSGTIRLFTDAQHEVAVIPFKLASLGAYEAKDISAPLKTKLRAYELPDWQFIKAEVQLKASAE